MANIAETIIRVHAAGFDSRSVNLLQMIFRANCRDVAELVGEEEAEAVIIDLDSPRAESLVEGFRGRLPPQAIMLMSVAEPNPPFVDTLFIRKPAKIADLLLALQAVRLALAKPPVVTPVREVSESGKELDHSDQDEPARSVPRPIQSFMAPAEKSNASQAAIHLIDHAKLEEIGYQAEIEPQNFWEAKAGRYDPGKYLQGHLENAYRLALARNTALRLNTGWKTIVILPQSREVMIEADEEQWRSFCLVPVHSIASLGYGQAEARIMSVEPASAQRVSQDQVAHWQVLGMEAFLWQVALWTSSGRVPANVEIARPIYLRRWPNFTRLQISPNALRISALLTEQSRAMPEICEILRIPPKDVFAFFSAAQAIGLAGQARRQSEGLITMPAPPHPGNAGILKKVLHRLFMGRRETIDG